MSNGGYIKDNYGVLKYVGSNIPLGKQEFDATGNPVISSGSGGNPLIWLIWFLMLAPIALISGLCALLSGLLLLILIKLFSSSLPISFSGAYKAAFWTTFGYLILAGIFGCLQVLIYPDITGNSEEISTFGVLKYFYFYKGSTLLHCQLTYLRFRWVRTPTDSR